MLRRLCQDHGHSTRSSYHPPALNYDPPGPMEGPESRTQVRRSPLKTGQNTANLNTHGSSTSLRVTGGGTSSGFKGRFELYLGLEVGAE
jgi:hypothetical protein